MSTKKTTTLRRCAGSTRFGIEPHEAPLSEFPKQPSRKDGLGTMCTEHWRAYVKGLREARAATATAPTKAAPKGKGQETASTKPGGKTAATKRAPSRTARLAARNRATASPKAAQVAEAEALIAQVDGLPGPEHVRRVGEADVQAALETSAAARMLAD